MYNDSTVCHPLLLSQGNKSEKGLCDDTTSAVVISAIILFIHTCLLLVSVGGLVYKLRMLHILQKEHKQVVNYLQVARNPALMVMGAIIGWTYTFVLMTRVLIGRKIYPCFIFSLIYYLAVPALSNTVILRCIRLLVLTKLNELKVRIGKRQYDLHATTSSENMKPLMDANVSLDILETLNNTPPSANNPLTTDTEMKELKVHSETSSVSSSSGLLKATNRTSLSALTVGRTSSIMSQFTIEPKDITTDKPLEDEMIFRKETLLESFERGKLISIMRFLVSSKFIFIYYGLLLALHILIFLIIGTIDYFNFQNTGGASSNSRNSFTIDSYLFSPSGCGTGSYNQNIFISYFAFYGFIGVLLLLFSFFTKRDVWHIKIEVIVVIFGWVFFIVLYAVPSLFTIFTTYIDYYFPWTITILIGNMWDTLISFTYPVFFLQRFKSDKKQHTESTPSVDSKLQHSKPSESSIRKILLNEKWNNLFLKFSEKCFACEDVMMWNAIEKFKTIKSEKQRRELFYNICNTYIRIGAPLELNISRKDFGIPEIEKIFKSLKDSTINFASKNGNVSPSPKLNISPKQTSTNPQDMSFLFAITPEIFDRIQTACEHNMLDNYTRFQASYEKQLEKELSILPKMKV
ncbi:predicted protein [Naegleria gruberi]|uniref:Predicted protein n=1 Tax=Naegleria gruberi TaxID=5762 RepID=D2VJ52_NAEGR|nr:uncharacterized protein NAEGRDRAFT_68910 [Naegleria gruberi]EFC43219.1 predicted protein [Naegleria gruberi]|eukprot:XP_002675963.1 predicted protein [Naegleria gruberi strain NEG-M]